MFLGPISQWAAVLIQSMTAQLLLLENNTLSCLLFLFFASSFTAPQLSRKACEAGTPWALTQAVIHGIAASVGIAVLTIDLKDVNLEGGGIKYTSRKSATTLGAASEV